MIPLLLSLLPLLLDITNANVIGTPELLTDNQTTQKSETQNTQYSNKSVNPKVAEDFAEPTKSKTTEITQTTTEPNGYNVSASTVLIYVKSFENHSETYQNNIKNISNNNNQVKNEENNVNSSVNCVKDDCEDRHNREVRSGNIREYDAVDSVRTTSGLSLRNIDIEVLSQVYNFNFSDVFSGPEPQKAKPEVENLVKSKNETMKSLGSVDVMVPSLKGMELVPIRDQNSSRIHDGNRMRNRSNSQGLGRTDAPMLNYIFDTHSTLNKHHHRNDRFGGPKFETQGSTVSVDTEEDAFLDCKVASLQDKLVSWVRRHQGYDKLDILTIGLHTYTADPRFSVDFLGPSTWRLVLRNATFQDSGTYECQLSTHPPLISRHQLTVHAPVVEIVESAVDKYYERNSTLELGCRVRHLPTTAVSWLHHTRLLNDDTQRGGISVRIESVAGGADSTLQVARLTAGDGGRYTCAVRKGLQASINVHVLNESLAELQQTAGVSTVSPLLPATLTLVLLLSVLLDHLMFFSADVGYRYYLLKNVFFR